MIFNDINLKELFGLMKEYGVSETTLKSNGKEITVKRQNFTIAEPISPTSLPIHGPVTKSDREEEITLPVLEKSEEKGKYHVVTAPLVGTFYRASSPDAEPFVEIGDRIDVGDVLCIIEAMKSMNEIQSEVSGVVKSICVENAQMVEFEQVLFKIDTQG